jgi:hypothetical protein
MARLLSMAAGIIRLERFLTARIFSLHAENLRTGYTDNHHPDQVISLR